jgi:riboflavin synthase alpha subunit
MAKEIHNRLSYSRELKIDQSLAHNGVCLTVVDIKINKKPRIKVASPIQWTMLTCLGLLRKKWQLGQNY